MKRATALVAGSTALTLYGFVPTGVVALGLSVWAMSLTCRGEDPGHARRLAVSWLLVTLFVGAAVDVPVIAAALIRP